MKQYSPVKKIYVKNFRNIGEAIVDFEESPIISLVGENESGKTSIEKAFAVCALHANPRDQKDYIRDGTTGFGVAIELQDGTLISRMKTKTTNRYQVKNADGTAWATDKIEAGIPKEVFDNMGMMEEPETKEYLQVRTYEDQLLFVTTPASTNYKVMYDALKVDQLTKAIKSGSQEVNKLRSDIGYDENSISTLSASLRTMKIRDIQPLLNIKSRIISDMTMLKKFEAAVETLHGIENSTKELGALGLIETSGISEIKESNALALNSISRLVESINGMSKSLSSFENIDTAEQLDTTLVSKMGEVIDKVGELSRLEGQAGALGHVNEICDVSEIECLALSKALSLVKEIDDNENIVGKYSSLEAEAITDSEILVVNKIAQSIAKINSDKENSKQLEGIDTYVDQLLNWMKSVGVATTDCPKCGESVIIDLSLFNG